MNYHCINIVAPTTGDELYDLVALNKYPLIMVDEEDTPITDLLKLPEFQSQIRPYIKNKNVFNKAKFYCRTINETSEENKLIIAINTIMDYE